MQNENAFYIQLGPDLLTVPKSAAVLFITVYLFIQQMIGNTARNIVLVLAKVAEMKMKAFNRFQIPDAAYTALG
jgi:hypothetical protein